MLDGRCKRTLRMPGGLHSIPERKIKLKIQKVNIWDDLSTHCLSYEIKCNKSPKDVMGIRPLMETTLS